MVEAIINELATGAGVIVGLAAGVVAVVKMFDHYHKYKSFKEKCEGYEDDIAETNRKIENAHQFAQDALAQMQSENDAKLQQISSELCMISYGLMAALDGLKQLNCNGPVTEAREKFDKHINKQAHGVE